MKKNVYLLPVCVLIFFSCNKSTNSTSPPSGPNPPDTGYLRKSEVLYTYDQSNTNITDSTVTGWRYDDQGRMIAEVSYETGGILQDSFLYTYTSGKTIQHVFRNFNLPALDEFFNTFYLNSFGKADSVTTVSAGPAPNSTDYSYYDASGNDTLDLLFTVSNGNKTLQSIRRNYYTANLLDSVTIYGSDSSKSSASIYGDGNLLSNTFFTSGVTTGMVVYTYNADPSKGFYGYEYDKRYSEDKNLVSTVTSNFSQPFVYSSVETYQYTFDSANRVNTITISQTGSSLQKEVFTYY